MPGRGTQTGAVTAPDAPRWTLLHAFAQSPVAEGIGFEQDGVTWFKPEEGVEASTGEPMDAATRRQASALRRGPSEVIAGYLTPVGAQPACR